MVCHISQCLGDQRSHQDCFEQQVKLLLFIKHALLISIVGLSLGITSLYETWKKVDSSVQLNIVINRTKS